MFISGVLHWKVTGREKKFTFCVFVYFLWSVKLLLFLFILFNFIWACDFYVLNRKRANKMKRMFDSWMLLFFFWVQYVWFQTTGLWHYQYAYILDTNIYIVLCAFFSPLPFLEVDFYECIKTERKQTREWKVAFFFSVSRKLGVKMKPPNVQFYGW